MSSGDEGATLAVVVSRLDDLRADLGSLRTEVQSAQRDLVTRGEWGQRNAHVDTRLNSHGREIGDLRQELHSRRAPWWSVWTVALSGCAVAWSVLGPVIRG